MRFLLLLVLLGSLQLVAQEETPSLKNSLFEAEKKYSITFTFDYTLISGYLPIDNSLPSTLEGFKTILEQVYKMNWNQDGTDVILSPKKTGKGVVCGYLKNDLFDEVIQNATILLGNRFSEVDAMGYFYFQNVDPSIIELTFLSEKFGTKTQSIDFSQKCPIYYINTSEIDLDEVIINYIAPPIEKESGGSFAFNLNQFQSSPGSINPDYLELLKLIPGVNTPNEDNQLFIRGGTPDQNQILWNQIRIYQNNHANGSLSSLNPSSIDQVKLYVKGVPASYGEHTAGLILLENYLANSKPLAGSFGVGLLDSDLVVQGNVKDKIQFNLSARSSFNTILSDQFKTNTFSKIELINPSEKQVFSQQQLYYNDFSFSSRLFLNEGFNIDIHGFYMEDQIGYELVQENIDYSDFLNTISSGFGLRMDFGKGNWNHHYNTSFYDYQLSYQRDLIQYEMEADEIQTEKEFEDLTKRENHIQEFLFNSNHKTSLFRKNDLTFGSEFLYRDVELFNENSVNEEAQLIIESLQGFNLALYSTYRSSLFTNNTIDLGLRYNYFESLGISRLEPRINLNQKISKQWRINTSYEKKSQSIYKTNETIQNTTSSSNNLWTFAGNEVYPLLKSTQFSLGITRKGNGTIFDLDFYYRNLKGVTTFNFGYLDRNDSDYHLGESKIRGVDLFLQKNWNNLNLWTNYSFQDNLNRFDDLKGGLWFNSNFLVKHLLTIGMNYTLKGWNLSSNYILRSGIPYSSPTGYKIVNQNTVLSYEHLNSEFLPSFHRLDASITKRIRIYQSFKMDLKIAFKNLTNRRNILERIYLYDSTSSSIKSVDRYSMVPFINFGVRFTFD
ncbi:MAG: TonB-dependent receptor plug domain-containing protein [Flavobacteriaceae bacterium]